MMMWIMIIMIFIHVFKKKERRTDNKDEDTTILGGIPMMWILIMILKIKKATRNDFIFREHYKNFPNPNQHLGLPYLL